MKGKTADLKAMTDKQFLTLWQDVAKERARREADETSLISINWQNVDRAFKKKNAIKNGFSTAPLTQWYTDTGAISGQWCAEDDLH